MCSLLRGKLLLRQVAADERPVGMAMHDCSWAADQVQRQQRPPSKLGCRNGFVNGCFRCWQYSPTGCCQSTSPEVCQASPPGIFQKLKLAGEYKNGTEGVGAACLILDCQVQDGCQLAFHPWKNVIQPCTEHVTA